MQGDVGPDLCDEAEDLPQPRGTGPRSPRYAEIFETLAGDIRSGRYPIGGKLPPELDLCDVFGASRHTVREAIRRLADQGLIRRRGGAGTVVLRRTREGAYTQQISALPELITYVKNARLQSLEGREIQIGRSDARMLKCRRGETWFRLAALKHLRGGKRPVAYLLAFIHGDHPALRGIFERGNVDLHAFIEERTCQPIATVEQEFSAKPILGREAERLGVAPGTAGFVILRRYFASDGAMPLVSYTVFPHDRMNYAMTLRLAEPVPDFPDRRRPGAC